MLSFKCPDRQTPPYTYVSRHVMAMTTFEGEEALLSTRTMRSYTPYTLVPAPYHRNVAITIR